MTINETFARRAVVLIVNDLSDRRGLKHEWQHIDADVKREIKKEWRRIVRGAIEEAIRVQPAS